MKTTCRPATAMVDHYPSLRWIGVTGLGRSGTTFLGESLAMASTTAYLHEPFNPSCGITGIDWAAQDLLNDDLIPHQAADLAIERLLALKGRLSKHVPASDPWTRRMAKRIVGGRGPVSLWEARVRQHLMLRRIGKLTDGILKDPVGFPIFRHLGRKHRFQNLLVIKHPVAHLAGLRRVNWISGLKFLASRPYLQPHLNSEERRAIEHPSGNTLIDLAWYWRIANGLLLSHADADGWEVVAIEAISAEPVKAVEALCARFGLGWNERCRRRLQRLTGPGNGSEKPVKRVQELRRDSRKVFAQQASSVTLSDRQAVYEITWPVASRLYGEASFGLCGDAEIGFA